ncbi:MAG: vancomycin resistance histidine kinase VanS [Lachnospiraceae bacterium]|nr:vancomycin resistance histidine kinase VanS [Lachnospiraceae bacterium]
MWSKKRVGEYRQLQEKIFLRTSLLLLIAIVVTFAIYSLILQGRIADFTVSVFNYFTRDYESSLNIYNRVIRSNIDVIAFFAILSVFLLILRIYLVSFSRYFNEINHGIDKLIEEDSNEILLSPELSATEQKINQIKHTLKQQRLEAEAAEQRKNDLVVYLAHDLKTPLTSVIGYLTLLRDEPQISEELRQKYLSISLEKAERLEELINEFFEITRFNLQNLTLSYEKVNLTRLLEQLTYEFKPIFAEKNLNYFLEIEPDTMIRCDINKMQRVLDNLLRNAVNYSFENTTIHILAAQNTDSMHIKFINQGPTIPQEKLERIFEQFYRLDTARSSKSGGAGLGLAIAKEIVELHHGRITAKSSDEIIEFHVMIPISPEN